MNVGWTHIAVTAGDLFLARGFRAVSLRQVASQLGIQAASLYHHCPAGKAELYERSIEEVMGQVRGQLERAIGELPFRDGLHAAAEALMSSPPVDFRRIQEADLPALEAAGGSAERVMGALHAGVHEPLRELVQQGKAAGDVREDADEDLAAAALLALVLGLVASHGQHATAMLRPTLEILLRGIGTDAAA
jgi:AcrR family transcriptional regulator